MSVIAIYNMKGGVGKTTAAVNLSYLAAAGGERVLLWDLDPQAAATFAFRVRARVKGFGRKSLESGESLVEAIKETDYNNLDLLPADFAYRKLDRLLDRFGKPEQVVTTLLDTLRGDYDTVFLDCPAGFSLLTESILAAADGVLVPAIPTILSLRMVARVVKWADRADSPADFATFFSMVDRRKALHRQATEWSASHPDLFLDAQVPYASIVEQMTVRRLPLPVFAPADVATCAFAAIWDAVQTRRRSSQRPRHRDGWSVLLRAIESLIVQIEDGHHGPGASAPEIDRRAGAPRSAGSAAGSDVHFVHRFDTESGDLQRYGYVLELHERMGRLLVVASRTGPRTEEVNAGTAVIDRAWAQQILSGAMSPLVALERRLGPRLPSMLADLRAAVGARRLQRFDSRVALRGDPNLPPEGGSHASDFRTPA